MSWIQQQEEIDLGEKMAITATCNDCGYPGTLDALKLHSCQIQEQGGRCEDYPCCGHTDGDGCQTLPSHTADYWTELYYKDPDLYDEMDQYGWPDEN